MLFSVTILLPVEKNRRVLRLYYRKKSENCCVVMVFNSEKFVCNFVLQEGFI